MCSKILYDSLVYKQYILAKLILSYFMFQVLLQKEVPTLVKEMV